MLMPLEGLASGLRKHERVEAKNREITLSSGLINFQSDFFKILSIATLIEVCRGVSK